MKNFIQGTLLLLILITLISIILLNGDLLKLLFLALFKYLLPRED